MRLRAADLRGGRGLAALFLSVATGIPSLQLGGRAQAMVGGAPPAPREFGRSVVMILGSSGTACTATERHPQFDIKRLFNHLATADVALIKLAQPLPARISPAPIAGGSETVAVGDSLVVAGYGVTLRGDGRTGGTARATTLVVTGQPGPLQVRLFDPVSKGLSAGLGACAGDSGAPAFRPSSAGPAILGVVSWSTGPNLTAGCGGLTGVTPLARYRGWIVDTARRLGTPLTP